MNLIIESAKNKKVQDFKKVIAVEIMRTFLNKKDLEKGSDEERTFLDQMDIIVSDIEQDQEFLKSVEEAVKAGIKSETEQV